MISTPRCAGRSQDVVYPKLQFSTATDFFADLKQHESELKLPTWDGELYFQYHRGVQTTQSEDQEGQSQERSADPQRREAGVDRLALGERSTRRRWLRLRRGKKILFNQFHDILPGSGIGINYVDAARKYAETSRFSNDTIHAALNDIASHVKSDGVSVLVFNPLSWPRTEEVEVEVQFPNLPSPLGIIAGDPSAERDKMWVLSDIVSSDPATGKVRLRILASDVPALGYKLIQLHAGSPKLVVGTPQTEAQSMHITRPLLNATATSLENDFLKRHRRSRDRLHHQPLR